MGTFRSADFAAWALAGSVAAYLGMCGTGLKPTLTLTDRTSWAWEITAFCFFLKVAQDNKEKVADLYWAKALVVTGIAAFGGGFLAPLLVARTPVPLREETFTWMLVVAWYVTHHLPVVSDFLTAMMSSPVASVMFKVFFNIFKTQQMVGSLELAANAIAAEKLLPHSAYFPVAIAAPLVCGFLGGCGGMFLPASTGLKPIEEGKVWNVRAAFFCPLIYFSATRFCGYESLDAKIGICLLRMAGDLFPAPRDRLIGAGSAWVYSSTSLRAAPLPIVVPVKFEQEPERVAQSCGPSMGA
jgi:hypothetical protein